MPTYSKIAFGSYLLFILLSSIFGVAYLTAGEIRLHHLGMIGVGSWADVIPEYKVMLLMFMKGAGSGYLSTALAMSVVLFGPFRKREAWSLWALAGIGLVQLGGRWVNVMSAGVTSQMFVPLVLLVIGTLLVLSGFCFSLLGIKTEWRSEKEHSAERYSLLSLCCYAFIAVINLLTAFIYLTSDEIMLYHVHALGVSNWSEIADGYHGILLTYMRGAGVSFLTTAFALAFFLVVLIGTFSNWLRWGLLWVTLLQTSVIIYVSCSVAVKTAGQPPITLLLFVTVLAIAGFALPPKRNRSSLCPNEQT